MKPGSKFTLPTSEEGSTRSLYLVEGTGLTLDKTKIPGLSVVQFKDHSISEIELEHTGTEGNLEILILQGKPISEPVAQHGPFVMNTHQELAQTFREYEKTRFGGWPWPHAHVFPREKGRFLAVQGKPEEYPPSVNEP
ncbi:hypothetical protein HDU99_010917 [Rhizoclosmatium hyalinum]|nr:hypothetical protein HDU99_010917 [Rhizoclosmatium hyalinum]